MGLSKYHLWADGSSNGKVGEGGWAFVVLKDPDGSTTNPTTDPFKIKEDFGGRMDTTNNQMELSAVIRGLEWLYQNNLHNEDITVYTDSQYVTKGMTEWYPAWEVKMNKGKTILNQSFWLELRALHNLFPNLKYQWVNGHTGIQYNEYCDKLAKKAKLKALNESKT